jgi:hypothetical protein
MDTIIERTQQLAYRVDHGNLEQNCPFPSEVAKTLDELSKAIQLRDELLRSIQFALEYYGDPCRYLQVVIPSDLAMDGGLRARTALYLMRHCSRLAENGPVLHGARL